MREDLTQEEKETFIGAVLLKDCDDSLGINFGRVLDSNLSN